MSNATFTIGRFNPPTEEGHGKLVSAVQKHAEETGGKHYIFPTHTQDKKKNPMSHEDKVGAMKKLFPTAHVVSHDDVRTPMEVMKHLESKGHTHVTIVAGSDRVDAWHKLLHSYREKEYPKIKKISVVSAGHRDPDSEGAEGMSASKMRELAASGKKKEFVSHYSNPKVGAEIHDKVKAGMQMKESVSPVGIFLLGGPGSGKDYVLKNIFSRFDLTEVQADQILSGSAQVVENKQNIVINGVADFDKIEMIKHILEGYEFDYVHVSVTNKVSRIRNSMRNDPLVENKRIEKFLKAEKLSENYDCFKFNNSINLNESTEMEQILFAGQIEQLLERLVTLELEIKESVSKDKESGLPKKYVSGLSSSTAKARAAHWKEKDKLSDRDPRAYEPAPGDATAKTKPSKHTKKFHAMYGEASSPAQQAAIAVNMKKRGVKPKNEEAELDEAASGSSLSAKAKKSGISIDTLRKVYNRGMAAWNSGHRPGTTPQQWAMARVNSYITHGKGTYGGADKDLHEENVEEACWTGYTQKGMKKKGEKMVPNCVPVKEAVQKVEGTNCGNCVFWCHDSEQKVDKSELNENGGLKAPNKAYLEKSKHADLISLPGKGTASIKTICEHPDIMDFVTERMCCAYWNGEGTKREYKGKSPKLDEDINSLFEMQLVGTDEYRDHAIATTPGQKIEDAYGKKDCACGGVSACQCGPQKPTAPAKPLSSFRKKAVSEAADQSAVDFTPTAKTKKTKKGLTVPTAQRNVTLDGMPTVSSKISAESKEISFSSLRKNKTK